MAEVFARSVLRVAIAQMCQNVGWNGIQSTPMELLVDILHRYLEELGKTTHRYCEQFGRTEPNLDDLGLAFKDIGVPLGELEDFVNNVEPLPFVHEVPKFPLARPNDLEFPKPDNREVLSRPEWIHEHLPLMCPEAEEEECTSPTAMAPEGGGRKDMNGSNGNETTVLNDGTRVSVKRPLDIESLMQTPKRARLYSDDEGRPMREVTSVFMTPAGVISPIREGRLPEAKTPSKLAEESQPATPEPPPVVEVKKETKKESKKEVKKEVKKDEKKVKEKKEKKDLKKKSARKDKEKKENKDKEKKEKSKDKVKVPKANKEEKEPKEAKEPKEPKEQKEPKENVDGIAAKIADMKAKVKSKIPKQKQNKLKPFFLKPKHKEKANDLTKMLKVKSRKKTMKPITKMVLTTVPKVPKSPRRKKTPVQAKVTKAERSVAANQVAPIVIRAPPKEVEIVPVQEEAGEANDAKSKSLIETLSLPSGEDSPERLVIDDNPETLERQERESRMAALNESIDAAIQRGLEETEKQRQEAEKQHEQATRDIDETIEDVIRQGVFESHVKLEPRDVYDFTDDETSPPATPVTPRTPEAVVSPPKKKAKKESPENGRKVKDKIKEKIKQKTKEPKNKNKSPLKSLFVADPPVDEADEQPKTPEAASRTPSSDQQSPFQSHTPPNMPMPPMGFYVRNPKPEAGGHKTIVFPPGNLHPTSFFSPGMNGMDRVVEEMPVKIKQEKADEPEKVKAKDHRREKKEKAKLKEAEKEAEKESEKPKTKRKKEKAKEKEKKEKKAAAAAAPPPPPIEEPKTKSKAKEKKEKEKEEKPAKSRERNKEKNKGEKKERKKKEDKVKEEVSGSPSSVGSSIPRITFKLGNTAATEGTKIVIKSVMPRDSTQSSAPSPTTKETSPPSPTVPLKSHPKPQSKVNPVPPAPKAAAAAVTAASSTPARTVITETVGTIIDEQGNKIWICPACTRPDDGSPMIGCDECDDWYHWVCVGIVVPPKEEENWFCKRCIGKKKQTLQKKKKKKHRKDKPQN